MWEILGTILTTFVVNFFTRIFERLGEELRWYIDDLTIYRKPFSIDNDRIIKVHVSDPLMLNLAYVPRRCDASNTKPGK